MRKNRSKGELVRVNKGGIGLINTSRGSWLALVRLDEAKSGLGEPGALIKPMCLGLAGPVPDGAVTSPPANAREVDRGSARASPTRSGWTAEARLAVQSGLNPVRITTMLYAVSRDLLFYTVKATT